MYLASLSTSRLQFTSKGERERERLHFPGLSFMRVIDAQSAFVEKARYLADMERR